MSRTIVTKSGSDFYTNISSEEVIGILCKECGLRYFSSYGRPTMVYSMSEIEAKLAAEKFMGILDNPYPYFDFVKDYFVGDKEEKVEVTMQKFFDFVKSVANDLINSKGFKCVS